MWVLILRDRNRIQYNSFKEKIEIEDIITTIHAPNNDRLFWESPEMLS